MGIRTTDYFLLGTEIDFYQHPVLSKLSFDESFAVQYEGLSNPFYHKSGQLVQLYDEEQGMLLVGFAISVRHDGDETLGTHRLTTENLKRWRELYDPQIKVYLKEKYQVQAESEFLIFSHSS